MITIASIQAAVAREHGIDPAIMRAPDGQPGTRLRINSWPRQEAMRLALLLTEHSTVRVGQLFGGRDHSTVILGVQRVGKRMTADDKLRERMRRVTLELLRPAAWGRG